MCSASFCMKRFINVDDYIHGVEKPICEQCMENGKSGYATIEICQQRNLESIPDWED
ncbi:MAG: hypothetical protein BWY64_02835 [bacterium ADurb.Bin363]|nr:MAG: hypothetical protein BWY64_02835 [bacterium ADurb.Bin363]